MNSHVGLQRLGHSEPLATLHALEGPVVVAGVVARVRDQRVRSRERPAALAACERLRVRPQVRLQRVPTCERFRAGVTFEGFFAWGRRGVDSVSYVSMFV